MSRLSPSGAVRYLLKTSLWHKQNGECVLCGKRMNKVKKWQSSIAHPRDPTIEHLVPKSRGGKDSEENMALSCWSCNNIKGGSVIVTLRGMTA